MIHVDQPAPKQLESNATVSTRFLNNQAGIVNNSFLIIIASDGCSDGSVRLMSGGLANGRLEVCYSNVWGSICGKDFDHTDAYVVCKELGRGVSGEIER